MMQVTAGNETPSKHQDMVRSGAQEMTQAEGTSKMRDLLQMLVEELVDKPDQVEVTKTTSEGGNTVVMTVRTANGEVGKVIGRQGRNAQALRVLLEAVAAKYKQRVVLEIADGVGPRRRRSNNGQRGPRRGD